MDPSIVLHTPKLVLRPVSLEDADEIEAMVSERDVAATTANIPHPYPTGGAATYIRDAMPRHLRGEAMQVVARRRHDSALVGAIGLSINTQHARAEIGYWVGKGFWNAGYCTEAAAAVVEYAFSTLRLNRVFAHHMRINPASGRVMQKLGMKHEATLRQHIIRFGEAHDVDIYGITRSEYHPRPRDAHKDSP